MKLIPLSKKGRKHKGKYFAQVDDEDYEMLMKFNWSVSISAKTNYAIWSIIKDGIHHTIKLHRMIMRITDPKVEVDHLDHNGLNCQKNNLRAGTKSNNQWNRNIDKTNKSSRYIGVTWKKKNNRWEVHISHNNKRVQIGCFIDEIQAAKAYDKKAFELRGNLAKLNFKEIDNSIRVENNRHKWDGKIIGYTADSGTSKCIKCGCVKKYVKGVITFFRNDTVTGRLSPPCDNSLIKRVPY